MKVSRLIFGQLLTLLAGLLLSAAIQAVPDESRPVTKATTNADCLECHGVEGFAVPRGVGEGRKRSIHVNPAVFADSVHGKERCVACHTDIKQMPHKKNVERAVDCVQCHEKQETDINKKVMTNEKHYLASIHAQPREDDPNRVNATCWDCHGTHNVFPVTAAEAQTYRLSTPETCGRCHEKELNDYTQSVHGAAVKRYGNLEAAVCSDCHTAHEIESPEEDPVKLLITQNCGSCHEEQYETYSDTYHGQVHRLGYTHTAKCYDCHDYHNVVKIDDEKSSVHVNNRLKTCQKCHENATAGFIKFYPHGTTHDFDRYPEIWIASKFMIALLVGVFLFFWIHGAFWFYREYKERKTGKVEVRLDENGDPAERKKHVRRFSAGWRLAHLILAIAVMVLVLTGTAVLYAESFWAPTVMMLLGGPKIAAIIHRIAAVTFIIIFVGHLFVIAYNIFIKGRGKFRWFGPDSLIPRWKDFTDFWDMCKWFVGKGPRPRFDRWTYWEKFDYWAPFWGMFIIGCSGIMLWQPDFFASFLPGWIFNVATLVHGEEAFLAAVFLFSVHYFNSHFRPDKFPQDTIMFTGSMTLEEFKEERPIEYERLVKEGRLEEFLVGAPSPRMARYSEILGFILIAAGIILLFLVLAGFIQTEF
jgi:cytochrome b subunit of formate dehydrogenase